METKVPPVSKLRNRARLAGLVAVALFLLGMAGEDPVLPGWWEDLWEGEGNGRDRSALVTHWMPGDSEPVPMPAGAALVRDDGGPVAEIVMYLDLRFTNSLTPLFNDLFRKMPLDVQFQVICADGPAEEFFNANWGDAEKKRGREMVVLTAYRPLTMWSRDRHLGVQAPGGGMRISLVPKLKSTEDKDHVAEVSIPKMRFGAGLVDRIGFLPFHLEGGNIVSNGRHVFAGANLLEENAQLGATPGEITQELSALFGRELVFLGSRRGRVPFDHLDMYLTPVDNETVLLADLEQGAALIQSQSGRTPLASVRVDALKQRQLRDIGAKLKKLGYKVERLPAVQHSEEGWLLTYNNVIMERRGGEKIVYMPHYKLAQLDKAAANVYKGLGFRVETVDASQVYRLLGTLRCVANVTRRKALASGPAFTKATVAQDGEMAGADNPGSTRTAAAH